MGRRHISATAAIGLALVGLTAAAPSAQAKSAVGQPQVERPYKHIFVMAKQVVPLTQLEEDLKTNQVPNFAWISPNVVNDMHGQPARTWRDSGVHGYARAVQSRRCVCEVVGGQD